MLLDSVKQELQELLYQALLKDIDCIKQNLKQDTMIAYAVIVIVALEVLALQDALKHT